MDLSDADVARLLATADKVEIIELLSRYHQTVDAHDYDGFASIFTADATCHYIGQEELFGIAGDQGSGLEAIVAFLRDALEGTETRHNMLNHVFTELAADTAHTRSYLFERGGITGVYEVDHVRTPAGWRIRRLVLEQEFPAALVAEIRARRAAT